MVMIRHGCGDSMGRQVRKKFQCEVDVNKAAIQLICPVPTICADLFELSHVAFCRYVDLFYRIRLKVLVFHNEVLHHDRVQNKRFETAQYVGIFTGKKGSDLWQSRKDNGNACIDDSFQVWPYPAVQVIGLVNNNEKVREAAYRFQVFGRAPVCGCRVIVQVFKDGGENFMDVKQGFYPHPVKFFGLQQL